MDKHLFELKFAVKGFERESQKCKKQEKLESAKLKKAIQKGDMEIARIHAENSIRHKNQALTFLRLAGKMDATVGRLQAAASSSLLTRSVAGIVKEIGTAMSGMDLQKVSNVLDKFEKQFDDLDVQTSCIGAAVSQVTTTSLPQSEVDLLIKQVADEADIELNIQLPQGQMSSLETTMRVSDSTGQDDLVKRLARLRQIP